jgi:iron(III) transport system substrate-binding protein
MSGTSRSTDERLRTAVLALLALFLVLVLSGCGEDDPTPAGEDDAAEDAEGPITVYSGRAEDLVDPLLDMFTEETGIEVEVRYGDTAEMAAQILEEGDNTPADVYYGQDAGALGALEKEGMLAELPDEIIGDVDERFRSRSDVWVGTSGRARTVVYNTDAVSEDDLPDSILDFTDPEWDGRIGWSPTNGSLQSFVTAMRVELGEDTAREWLEGITANDPRVYEGNTPIVEAAGRGEIDVGFVNHYYLYRFLEEDPEVAADNAFLTGDIGALVNVAGVAVLEDTDQPRAAELFVEFLLSPEAQEYFSSETFEYPLAGGVEPHERLPSLDEIETPDVDLSDLDDLQGTLELLREVGALE